jgi:hypothetical protein
MNAPLTLQVPRFYGVGVEKATGNAGIRTRADERPISV